MARLASLGQRLGYLAFLVSIVVFAAGLATGFTDAVATTLVALLVAGSAVFKGSTMDSYKANIAAIRNAAAHARSEAI